MLPINDESVAQATIVRMSQAGDLSVARSGINNRSFGDDLDGYAGDLAKRWGAHAAQASRR